MNAAGSRLVAAADSVGWLWSGGAVFYFVQFGLQASDLGAKRIAQHRREAREEANPVARRGEDAMSQERGHVGPLGVVGPNL